MGINDIDFKRSEKRTELALFGKTFLLEHIFMEKFQPHTSLLKDP